MDQFTAMIVWVAKDTQEMDRFFGLLRYFVQKVNTRQRRRTLLVSYLIVITMTLLSSLAIFRNFRIKHKLDEEEEIQRMTRTLFRIRDRERKRIALDIHDSLVHRLRELKIYTTNHIRNPSRDYITSEISSTIDVARDISFNLIPFITSNEAGKDFVNVVRNYAAEVLLPKNIKLNMSSLGLNKMNLPEDLRINIFRIIQEILNNVVKYADARTVNIKMLYSFPYVMFSVADDGKGLPENMIAPNLSKEHIGIYGMHERVKLLNGTITVSSKCNMGTKISIRIPYRGDNNG